MAEGGYDSDEVFQNTVKHGFKEDADDDQESLSTTQPFQPGEASTPYHRGEQIKMQTIQHEQAGLPSYEETSFGGMNGRLF